MRLVGDADLLLIGSTVSLEAWLTNITEGWRHPAGSLPISSKWDSGVHSDCSRCMSALESNSSVLAGSAADRCAHGAGSFRVRAPSTRRLVDNVAQLRQLGGEAKRPPAIAAALSSAAARDYRKALEQDRTDAESWLGFVRAAVASRHEEEGGRSIS